MIKPSDIPTDLAEYLCSAADFAPQHSRCLVANILNAAIEAGVVSPPCSCYGETLRPMLGVRFLFPGKPQHVWQEHWKGQL